MAKAIGLFSWCKLNSTSVLCSMKPVDTHMQFYPSLALLHTHTVTDSNFLPSSCVVMKCGDQPEPKRLPSASDGWVGKRERKEERGRDAWVRLEIEREMDRWNVDEMGGGCWALKQWMPAHILFYCAQNKTNTHTFHSHYINVLHNKHVGRWRLCACEHVHALN